MSFLGTASEIATIIGGLSGIVVIGTVTAVVLPRIGRLATWLSCQPVRSAVKHWSSHRFLQAELRGSARRLRSHLLHALRDCQRGVSMTTAEFTWVALGRPTGVSAPSWDGPEVQALAIIVGRALEPRRRSATLLGLVRELWFENERRLVACARYLEQFHDLRPAPCDELIQLDRDAPSVPRQPQFADFVSIFTGATVLIDSSQVQGGSAAGVRVWHRPEWEGAGAHASLPEAPQKIKSVSPYEARHPPFTDRVASAMTSRRVGQYDGSIPTLVEAALVERPGRAGALFALTTRQTCYVDTEPSDNPAFRTHCKGLPPEVADAFQPRFTRTALSRSRPVVRWSRLPSEAGDSTAPAPRTLQLNMVLGLVCPPTQSDSRGALIFTRRSSAMRNAAGGLGPSSGGVLEIGRDCDEFGALDPLEGVLREAREELGLTLTRGQVTPRAVYLATGRNRPVGDAAQSLTSRQLATGQLVATVLYLARVEERVADLQRRSSSADPVEGAFESEGIVAVELGRDADAFVRNLTRQAQHHGSEPGQSIMDQLEQSAVIVAMYASAWLHTSRQRVASTVDAWTRAFPRPWWAQEWPAPADGAASRLCRPPGNWLAPGADLEVVGALRHFWPSIDAATADDLLTAANDRLQTDHEHWQRLAAEVRGA